MHIDLALFVRLPTFFVIPFWYTREGKECVEKGTHSYVRVPNSFSLVVVLIHITNRHSSPIILWERQIIESIIRISVWLMVMIRQWLRSEPLEIRVEFHFPITCTHSFIHSLTRALPKGIVMFFAFLEAEFPPPDFPPFWVKHKGGKGRISASAIASMARALDKRIGQKYLVKKPYQGKKKGESLIEPKYSPLSLPPDFFLSSHFRVLSPLRRFCFAKLFKKGKFAIWNYASSLLVFGCFLLVIRNSKWECFLLIFPPA